MPPLKKPTRKPHIASRSRFSSRGAEEVQPAVEKKKRKGQPPPASASNKVLSGPQAPPPAPSSYRRRGFSNEIAHVDVETRTYSNGLRVISERVEGSSSLALGLWIRAGSKHEAKSKAGIAHFIEHVVFKGTAGKSMREIMRSVESKGGYLNAFTTKEHTCFYTWTRTGELALAAQILFELAARPNFTARDIEREKSVVIEEINGIEDEPDELVFDLFESLVFGDNSLGRPILGTPQTVNSFTREDLIRFHARHYRARDIAIVASGAHSHEELFKTVEDLLKHVPLGGVRSEKTEPQFPRKPEMVSEVKRAAGQQAHIILGRRAPGLKSPDQLAITALVTLLGVGMSSRLNLRLREELGLAYDAVAFYSPFEKTGSVGLYVATAVENNERAVREMKKIVRGMFTRPISQAELDRTKEQLVGGLILSMESITTRMMRTAQNELYFGAYHPIERELERVSKLTLAEVRTAAEKWFDAEELIRVSVVPGS